MKTFRDMTKKEKEKALNLFFELHPTYTDAAEVTYKIEERLGGVTFTPKSDDTFHRVEAVVMFAKDYNMNVYAFVDGDGRACLRVC